MKIITPINEIKNEIKKIKASKQTIAFVPTMGYLHDGHLALIKAAKKECDVVIVSIFINPLQFAQNEDLNKYPRDLTNDSRLCIKEGVDIIFTPNADEIIENNLVSIDIKELSSHMCGKRRIGHFNGVCTIITKFFNIIQPSKVFFGKKDIQQLKIVRKLITDLNFDIELIAINTQRNSNGLALSSRNSYLSADELNTALIVPNTIKKIHDDIVIGKPIPSIIDNAINHINSINQCKVDYIEILDSNTLQPITENQNNLIIAAAVFVGKTRLIDNMMMENEHAN